MTIRRSLPALALLLLASTASAAAPVGPTPGVRRGGGGGAAALELDGAVAGGVAHVDAPMANAEVIAEPAGANYFVKKHIGGPRYGDITFSLGADASKSVRDWIAASWAMNYQRKNGSLHDGTGKVEFFNALISEIGFPAVDADGGRADAPITLRMAPEYTRRVKAGKERAGATAPTPLSPSQFSFALDGLDTAKVAKIEAFTIKQTVVSDDIGDARDYLKEPGKIDFPNLTVYMPRADAKSFVDWHEDFVLKGNCEEAHEKSGRIVYFASGAKAAAWEVELFNVGIFAIDDVMVGDRKLLKIDLYVERMALKSGPAKEGAAGAPAGRKVSKRKPVPGRIPSGKKHKN